ncbi:hypothetical protein DSO57_1031050 [Entomophthora muscae]|uniref:Uncharacterized protein n=1 Tax=Entomophthora muscae TaxID=34485 RepID=A0ACC2SE33_9FUNG|nr:hypothetical protein DSO57_1031050 [Entomophthora muscae]
MGRLKQETYVWALTILKAKLDEILPTIKEEPKETRGCKKKAQSQSKEVTPTKNVMVSSIMLGIISQARSLEKPGNLYQN